MVMTRGDTKSVLEYISIEYRLVTTVGKKDDLVEVIFDMQGLYHF